MPWPVDTAWPASFDPVYGSGFSRVDGADIVWARDFNYQDTQILALQEFCGTVGMLIGEQQGSGFGPGGLISPADPTTTVGLRLATWGDFKTAAVEDILQVIDDFAGVGAGPTIMLSLSSDGILSTEGGADFGTAEYLGVPSGAADPLTFEAGRLFFRNDLGILKVADGAAWIPVGVTGPGAYLDWATGYQYTQAPVPVEEVIGQGYFDGSLVTGTLAAYFRAVVDTVFIAGAGPSQVKLYDMGAVGVPAAPIIITTLQTVAPGGPQVLEQLLSVGPGGPAPNTLADSARMYEITVVQTSTPGDTMFIGSAGLDVR